MAASITNLLAKKARRRMFRWNQVKDDLLLSEILARKPILEAGKTASATWTIISEAINKEFGGNTDLNSVKKRFKLLFSEYKNENFGEKRYKLKADFGKVSSIKQKLAHIALLSMDCNKATSSAAASAEASNNSLENYDNDNADVVFLNSTSQLSKTDCFTSEKTQDDINNSAFMTNQLTGKFEPMLSNKQFSNNGELPGLDDWGSQRQIFENANLHENEERNSKNDRDVRMRELDLKEMELDFERVKANHRMEMERQQLNLQRERFERFFQERIAFINTQEQILNHILFKK